jgi:hypothetical protein
VEGVRVFFTEPDRGFVPDRDGHQFLDRPSCRT